MRFDAIAALAAIVLMAGATTADARKSRQHRSGAETASYSHSHRSSSRSHRSHERASYSESSSRHGVGPRPAAWCGWWMRTQRGGGPEYNLAANWKRYGSPSGPQVGAVVVWPHHVGEIVGRASNGQWLVRSGNDSGRVQTRARSVSGAVFRI